MTCNFCHLTYVEDDPEDRRIHAARHRRWERATAALGYHPDGYANREEAKQYGHDLARNGAFVAERVAGAERVLRAWFDRSLESAIEGGYWRKHPKFGSYVAMLDLPYAFSDDVWQALRARYGRQPGVIPYGKSYWYADTPDSPYRAAGSNDAEDATLRR